MYSAFDHWAYWSHMLTGISMFSPCTQWVFGPLSPVTIITIRLSPSLRKKHQGGPEQPRFIEGQAPLLLDIEIHILLLAVETRPIPQNGRHSVFEIILLSSQCPSRVLARFSWTLCQPHLVLSDMRPNLRTTTETTTTTVTTTTLFADDLEDQ